MGKEILTLAVLGLFASSTGAGATTFTAQVADDDGRPIANAVVALIPDSKNLPAPSSRLPAEKTIDQRNETFIPLVTVVPKGGRIVFANNDETTHQVYSFSPVKQFEITLPRGEHSPPMAFDNPGVAALGCNIHDHMIAYAYVAESPWTAITGADGRAVINDVPQGGYSAQLWHPQLPSTREMPSLHAAVSGDTTTLKMTIKLIAPPNAMRMAHSHAGNY